MRITLLNQWKSGKGCRLLGNVSFLASFALWLVASTGAGSTQNIPSAKQFISFTNQYGPHVNVEVIRVTETVVVWRDTNSGSGGSARLADLPEDLRLKLGFDPVKAQQAEQKIKAQQEAVQKQRADSEALAAKLSHWEQLSVLTMEPLVWSRYKCAVKTEEGERRTVLIANIPANEASLSTQLRDAQAKGIVLNQQILAGQAAIAQGERNKEAAWDRYIYTPDDFTSVTVGSRGSSADTVGTRRAAPAVIQAQIEQAQLQVESLKVQYQDNLIVQEDLKRRLANIRVRAFFTGHYVDGLELWDCAPH